jgi:TM2 domain-containing membrane protein YozV
MRQKLIAFLLSALVFPGLGQLYNQDRRKGVILVLAANGLIGLVLLTGLILISREYTLVFFPRPLTWEMGQQLLFDTLTHPVFWVPFGLLLALWGYAMVDAARRAGPPPQA